MSKPTTYLDYHATTPVDPRVLEEMLPYFTEVFGNAASRSHAFGWEADSATQHARARIAALIGAASPREIVFTSGATESNNLALRGVVEAIDAERKHVITSTIEHKCVLDTCSRLEREGAEVTRIGVDEHGLVSVSDIEAAIRPETVLISVMSVNNEVGTIQPIEHIGRIAREHGVLFHTDAAQAAGRISIDVERDNVDLLSLSAHKLYGPKGVGALYVRRFPRRTGLRRLFDGGDQEFGLRPGTTNVPGVVGFGKAAEIVAAEWQPETLRQAELRDELLAHLRRVIPSVRVHGSLERRVAGNLSVSFPGVSAEALLNAVPELALSAGSACTSGTIDVSHVLKAMNVSTSAAHGAIRIGLGRFTTRDQTQRAARQIVAAVQRLRPRTYAAPERAFGAQPQSIST
jgi:cysteine desulfurase